MYLLDTETLERVSFIDTGDVPPYAILSHTWSFREVSFQDLARPVSQYFKLPGFQKARKCCRLAERHGLPYLWIDTCCIDQKSSAELSEAINSMYQWYKNAEICIVYLVDFAVAEDKAKALEALDKARWFKRGWTLQELLAPENVVFYDKNWREIGTRVSLRKHISGATGIDPTYLEDPSNASVATKMSWASSRKTGKPEDIAYCLLGLFDVNMPLLYGEGAVKAFRRLQHEILQTQEDESIFAWTNNHTQEEQFTYTWTKPTSTGQYFGPLFAPMPSNFAYSKDIVPVRLALSGVSRSRTSLPGNSRLAFQLTYKELNTTSRTIRGDPHPKSHPLYVAPLACANISDLESPVKLILEEVLPGESLRRFSDRLEFFSKEEMTQLGEFSNRTFLISQNFLNHGPLGAKSKDLDSRFDFILRLSISAQDELCHYGIHEQTHEPSGELKITADVRSKVVFGHHQELIVEFGCMMDPDKFFPFEVSVFTVRIWPQGWPSNCRKDVINCAFGCKEIISKSLPLGSGKSLLLTAHQPVAAHMTVNIDTVWEVRSDAEDSFEGFGE